MSLESVSPEKAITVSTRLSEGQNEQANQAVHSQVNTVLQGFNHGWPGCIFEQHLNLSDAQTSESDGIYRVVSTDVHHFKYSSSIFDPTRFI